MVGDGHYWFYQWIRQLAENCRPLGRIVNCQLSIFDFLMLDGAETSNFKLTKPQIEN
jgi:hypothetical protein